MVKTDGPNPVDKYVGSRVKQRRNLLGMSQDKLAEYLGVTFQQVQKYENGTNRIGSSRLFQISKALGVSIAFFFDEFEQGGKAHAVAESRVDLDESIMNRKETLDLVRAYYAIEDTTVRKRILDMVKSIHTTGD